MIPEQFKPGDTFDFRVFSREYGPSARAEVLRRLPKGTDLVVLPSGMFQVIERLALPPEIDVSACKFEDHYILTPKPMFERPQDRRYFFDTVLDQGEVDAIAKEAAERIAERRRGELAFSGDGVSANLPNPAAGYARSARDLPCYGQNYGQTGVMTGADPSRSKPGAILAFFDSALSVLFFLCIMAVCLPLAILLDSLKRNRRPDWGSPVALIFPPGH